MRWFDNLRLQYKLMLIFGLVMLLLAGVCVYTLLQLNNAAADLDTVAHRDMQGIVAAKDLQGRIDALENDIRQAALATDAQGKNKAKAAYDADLKQLNDDLATLTRLAVTAQGKADLAAARKAIDSWAYYRDKTIGSAMSGDQVSTTAVLASPDAVAATKAVYDATDQLANGKVKRVQQRESAAHASVITSRTLAIALLALAIVLGFAAAYWISRRVVSGLRAVQALMSALADDSAAELERSVEAMARFDLTVEPHPNTQPIAYYSGDEIGQTAAAANALYERLMKTIGSYEVARARLRELILAIQRAAGQVADSSQTVGTQVEQSGEAVEQVSRAIQEIARGSAETSRSAEQTNQAIEQLAQAIAGIARGAGDQATQVQAVASTANEMASGVEQVAANASAVAAMSEKAKASADNGARAVRETISDMGAIKSVVSEAAARVEELGKLGERIGAVVETIDDIAEQTNLLALNAAIEAARAGEHGRGFAVVADEVRKLAERSQRETRAIAELIAQVQQGTREAVAAMQSGSRQVESGVERADQAGAALAEILAAVESTVAQAASIAAAAQQMAAGARSMAAAVESISAVVEENSAATQQMSAQSSEVSQAIQSITAVAEENSAATEEVSASAEQLASGVQEVRAQARRLAETAESLRALVEQFTLDLRAAEASGNAALRAA
jgi:methyl-accepting chemotaxis protein